MGIRYFQIIIPIIALFFIYSQYLEYKKRKSGINETLLFVVFWIGVINLALFPDFFSETIANIFGIESNINALIFFSIGLLFYFQLKMYKKIKRQDDLLTELARKVALDNYDKK